MSQTKFSRSRHPVALRLAALFILLLLWGFAASDRIPTSISSAARANANTEQSISKKPEHDLSALRVFSRVVLLIRDNYFDPKRIEPRKMLVAALDYVERQVAEIRVDGNEKNPTIKVTVNKATKEFDVSGVDSLWNVNFALKEIFDFMNKNLSTSSKEDTRDIEYAAINGMLSTLDPHSVLLKPELYKEMKLQTKGEFGGLGFVIQMKEGNLTVVRVLKGTPAARAGIHRNDQIIRIGHESTVNMDVNEAVSRLRGKPGSEVGITVKRVGWNSPRPMTLTRANINVESVSGKLLEHNIGYIRLKGFQGNTFRDMYAMYKNLKQEAASKHEAGKSGLRGLVLDLRGNPGGLLDQAIQVSDAFLSEGAIVTTVGYSDKLREVKKSHPDESDIRLPLVVLVNSGSASASEIVAGALKNQNRAVIIGRPTFGKGSVQVLYDFPDESALKLTIAQYLTPGDVSIQETGITPDIELLASQVTQKRVDVFAPKKTYGEADLAGHFGNPNSDKIASKREDVVRREKPLEELRFLREAPLDKKTLAEKENGREKPDRDDLEMDELEGVDPDTDEIVEDYQIKFGRDLLLAAPTSTRTAMLKAAAPFIAQKRQEETQKIDQAIEALGFDWSVGDSKQAANAKLVAEMKPLPSQKVNAGETLAWTVSVQNQGSNVFKRLRGYSESDNQFLDRREFLFGSLAPGEKRSWTVNVKIPKETVSRRDEVKIKFADQSGAKLDELRGEVNVVELPRPAFAYSWQVVDRCPRCNGDGVAQLGETVELAVDVKNIGSGKSFATIGSLKNKSNEYISLVKGRSNLGEISPGQSKNAIFEFEVKPEFKEKRAALQLTIGDESTDVLISEKVDVPVANHGKNGKPKQIAVRASNDLFIHASANRASPIIAQTKKGTVLIAESRFGDMYRVKFGQQRTGFVVAKEIREVKLAEAKSASTIESVAMRSEPKIELAVDTSQGGLVTDSDRFTLSGVATDKKSLRDLYIFLNDQKVFFEAARDNSGRIKFTTDLLLKAGNNVIVVVAREDQDFMSRKLLIIHRRAGNELAQKAGGRLPGEAARQNLPLRKH